MQMTKKKTTAIALFLISCFAISIVAMPLTCAQAGTSVETLSFINVAPNPIGISQVVTVNFWLAVPLQSSELVQNWTVIETQPNGNTVTLGPFTSDVTGGTFTNIIPDQVGNYTFQAFFSGQTLTVGAYAGLYDKPSQSDVATLTVQEEPITGVPFTPLPDYWWQTPATAMNVQNWYNITGPWLGLGVNAFAATGTYNLTGNYNPYTTGPTTAHILWTKPWAFGGVAGGDAGGTESSNYWSTSQYQPKFAPVVINGYLYSTQYPGSTQNSAGIQCIDIYTGQTQWVLNTTNPLRCGQVIWYISPNQYGAIPYIWTTGSLPGIVSTGTQYNMYDAMTGSYVLSVVNGTSPLELTTDAGGNLIGYYINSSRTNAYPPTLNEWNSTLCINPGSQWSPRTNSVIDFARGIEWSVPMPTNISGVPISPVLNGGGYLSATGTEFTCNSGVIMLTSGMGQPSSGETTGSLVEAGFSTTDGRLLWIYNRTETPYTRLAGFASGNGIYIDINQDTFVATGYSLYTGEEVWSKTLTVDGHSPSDYDVFDFNNVCANGIAYFWGLGGDVLAINMATGDIIWSTNTLKLVGDPGYETPYGIWPLWVFTVGVVADGMLYLPVGHEYSPPLFHGARQLAINITDGSLVWSVLGFDVTCSEVSYGIMTTLNAYDNQIYAFGKGPSATTVTAPNVGVTTATPITIRGTVMDISAGAKQNAVASNYPGGLPCVSDESQSQWMEHVYMQQPLPSNTTGVPVTISVIDSNNNYRDIGTATTDTSGSFGFTWTPDITGDYTIIATFPGTDSYYGSCAETFFTATEPAKTPTTTTEQTTDNTATYVMYAAIAIIVAIIVVGIAIVLLLRKR